MPKLDHNVGAEPHEIARYIGGITRELRVLAGKADLTFLSYLLSMAEDEAMTTARGGGRKASDDEQTKPAVSGRAS